MNESVSEEIVPLEEEEYLEEDPVTDMIYNRPMDLYPLFIGQDSTDTVWQDMLSFVQTHSWTVENGEGNFDYNIYSDYLEQVLYVLLSDFNQASQFIASMLVTSPHAATLPDTVKVFSKYSSRKAFAHYLFNGDKIPNDIYKVNSEYDFDQIIEYYDTAPTHVKPAIADYLQKVTPMVYHTSE